MDARFAALWHVPVDLLAHLRDESHTSHASSMRALRSAYLRSRGRSRRAFRALFGLLRPASAGVDPALRPLLEDLRRDGVTTVPGFLAPEQVEAIRAHLSEQTGVLVGEGFTGERARLAEVERGLKLRYDTGTVCAAPGVLELASAPFVQRLAASYLGCAPIFTGLSAWWSFADPQATASDVDWAAQAYHFDYDWPAFVKFFVYLTDVSAETGPFTFVTGTHERKREWRDGRIDDATIEATYPGQVRELLGAAGDLVVADTVGYHKGKRLEQGRRLILQFEFAVTRLGGSSAVGLLPRAARPSALARHTYDVFAGASP